jgi:hypothetical protein
MNFLNMKVLAQHHRFTWYNLPFSTALDVKIKMLVSTVQKTITV